LYIKKIDNKSFIYNIESTILAIFDTNNIFSDAVIL
jgi:hypothetical protein